MEVSKFVKVLEKQFGPCVRRINYKLVWNEKKKQYKKKICNGNEDNSMTQEEIKTNRGVWEKGSDIVNAYAISNRVMKDIYTIDFDSKCEKAMKSGLLEVLKVTKCYYTETTAGFHYFVSMPDFPYNQETHTYSPNKIGSEGFELDLLKLNNTWETHDRLVLGENIANVKWFGGIDKFFDKKKMDLREKNAPKQVTTDEFNDYEVIDTEDINK